MAKDLVKLAFISAMVFCVLSPTIDVTKAKIVETESPKPHLESETVSATNEVEKAPSRRYGPLTRQPIFSGQVREKNTSDSSSVPHQKVGDNWCRRELWVESCNICYSSCMDLYDYYEYAYEYGQCSGPWPYRKCYCYYVCHEWPMVSSA